MLGLLIYHVKWGELLYNEQFIFHLSTSSDVSASQHHWCPCWLLSIRPSLTMFLMLLLCSLFFALVQETSKTVIYTAMLKLSTIRLLTPVDISNAPSSSTNMCMHGCWLVQDDTVHLNLKNSETSTRRRCKILWLSRSGGGGWWRRWWRR